MKFKPVEQTSSHFHLFSSPLTFLVLSFLWPMVCAGQEAMDVLSKNCFTCHGPLIKQPMGGLSMASLETLKRGGSRGPAVVPGKATESLLFKAITRACELKMPPSGPLTEKEIEIIRRWIDSGPLWTRKNAARHWAYRPITKPAVPSVKHPELVYNPIDAFIVAEYEKKRLTPVALADKNTLLRRITFGLTGLPPTTQDLTMFLSDPFPKAYETVVDRLLGNEQYGSHAPLCRETDKPISGLIKDLKQRGLFGSTLVVWATEFGRTPWSQNTTGRDHNPRGFTCWMAGGSVKGGFVHGSTDDVGFHAVEDKVYVSDLNATILHQMGLDHKDLTVVVNNRPVRLVEQGFGPVTKILG
jgi:hypothetical protein